MAVFIPLISAEEENEVSWYKAAAAGIASETTYKSPVPW